MKSFLRFITELNIWVALAVTSLCAISFIDLAISIGYTYILLVFFGTIAMYNFQRLVRMHIMVQEVYHLRARWYKRMYKWNLISLLLCTVPLGFFALKIELDNYLPIALAVLISIMYPLPVYKYRGSWYRLRDLPFFKIAMVSLVWGIVTVGIPRQLSHLAWDMEGILQFSERFLFIFAITIPFDIRDVKYDKQPTLPKLLGVKGARLLSLGLWASFIVLFLWNHSFPTIEKAFYMVGVTVFIVGYFLIKNASPDRNPLYFSFWIEGLPILQIALYLLLI